MLLQIPGNTYQIKIHINKTSSTQHSQNAYT